MHRQQSDLILIIQPGYKHFGTMHILNSKKGTYFIADTLINRHPDTDRHSVVWASGCSRRPIM